jgi:hypothetical protein
MSSSELRNLPSVDRIVSGAALASAVESFGRDSLVDLTREVLASVRRQVLAGASVPSADEITGSVLNLVDDLTTPSPRPVINATGVIIHTNLGRAPLSKAALAAADAAARGYSDLEIDLGTGRRGSRQSHLQSLLCRITGAEAALVVNNNASALLLGLSALAAGREVIVTRGEAVEIGGGFRIPDVLRQSGCTLVDVGTTNRTYVRDYADAITEDTGAFLKPTPATSGLKVSPRPSTNVIWSNSATVLAYRCCMTSAAARCFPLKGMVWPTSPHPRKASRPGLVWCSFREISSWVGRKPASWWESETWSDGWNDTRWPGRFASTR